VGEPGDTSDHLTISQWLAETLVRWRLIAATMALTLVVAVLAVIFIPPVYRTQVSFVANTTSGSRLPSSALSAAGPLAGIAAQFGMGGGADPSESPNFYVELIQSRELLTRLLESKFRDPRAASARDSARLIDILRLRGSDPQRRLEKGIKKMGKAINGTFDLTTSLVWLDVDAQWPDLSSAIANRTVELVSSFNSEQRVTRVRSKRVFLEDRVAKAKADLDAAEDKLRVFNEQNRSWRTAPGLVFKALWPDFAILAVAVPLAGLFLGFMIAGAAAVHSDWESRNPRSSTYLSSTLRRVKGEIRNAFKRSAARRLNT